MNIDLISDSPLRGVMFENAARVLLRRRKKNNFIFGCRYFDSVDEIISKYRLDPSSGDINVAAMLCFLRGNKMKGDLIEFEVDNVQSRKITCINFYDVKSKMVNTGREYYDVCVSDYEFMETINSMGGGTFIVPIVMNYRWAIGFDVVSFANSKLRIYDSMSGRTKFLMN